MLNKEQLPKPAKTKKSEQRINAMTDEEATPLHWLLLECLTAMLFEEINNDNNIQSLKL